MADPANKGGSPSLPAETIEFAHRMFDAARNGDVTLLQAALEAGLPTNLTNSEGNTLIMLAAYNGHPQLTKILVDRGADVNRINNRGQSPLAGAVFKGYDEVARILIAGNADPRLGTPTAIQTARMFDKADLLVVMGANNEDMKEAVPLPPRPPSSN